MKEGWCLNHIFFFTFNQAEYVCMGMPTVVFMLLIVVKREWTQMDAGGQVIMPQIDKRSISDFQIIKLVLDWAINNNFLATKLDGCSFQAPHASPGPRIMETTFLLLLSILFVSLLFKILLLCLICALRGLRTSWQLRHQSKKNYPFLYHYLLDECHSAFIHVLCNSESSPTMATTMKPIFFFH